MTTTPEDKRLREIAESDELIARIRARYTAEPVPPCPVCGAALNVARAGGGRATEYACDKHRPFSSDHYDRSRFTHYRPGDEDVLSLLDRALAAEADAASWKADAAVTHLEKARLVEALNQARGDLAAARAHVGTPPARYTTRRGDADGDAPVSSANPPAAARALLSPAVGVEGLSSAVAESASEGLRPFASDSVAEVGKEG